MRVAIVGSRDYSRLSNVITFVDKLPEGTIVVSGGARGVDSTAEVTAKHRGLETLVLYPDWKTHGKRAGFMRNEVIVANADKVVAFWDGESRGTKHTIDLARRKGLPVEVF